MCVLWFTSLSFPLTVNVFYKIFFVLFFWLFYFYFWFLFVCTFVYLPLLPTSVFFIFFVLYFKVIFLSLVFVCVCTLVYLLLLPIYFVHTILLIFEIYIFSYCLLFGHLALPTTCLTHALLLQVLEHCIFSQDRHIVVTAKPLQTSTANTPGILVATTRPCHSG